MILRYLSIDRCDADYDWTQCNTKEQPCDPLCIQWAGFDVQQRENLKWENHGKLLHKLRDTSFGHDYIVHVRV